MSKEQKHTPWTVNEAKSGIVNAEGDVICICCRDGNQAEFIVKAVNSYDDMLEALERIAEHKDCESGEPSVLCFLWSQRVAKYAIAKTKEKKNDN